MNHPKITVVTVCYNAERDIEKTILSVINQTYDNIEYIIVDGASTDGTMQVVEKYKDKIAKIVSEPDKGIYDAMNKGIKLATGEWVNFMNAGDCFAKKDVLNFVFAASVPADVGFIYGETNVVDELGNSTLFENHPFYSSRFPFRTGKGFCHQSTFVRTTLCTSGFDEKYRLAADFKMVYDIYGRGGKPFYVNTVVSIFSNQGVSSNKSNRLKCIIEDAEILGCSHSMIFKLYLLIHKILHK